MFVIPPQTNIRFLSHFQLGVRVNESEPIDHFSSVIFGKV